MANKKNSDRTQALADAGISGPLQRKDPNHLRALAHRAASRPPANPRAEAARKAARGPWSADS